MPVLKTKSILKSKPETTKPVWRLKIVSSTLEEARYDVAKQLLFIKFKSGKIYGYRNVSADEFSDFTLAKSQGHYFHEFIRDEKESYKLENKLKQDKVSAYDLRTANSLLKKKKKDKVEFTLLIENKGKTNFYPCKSLKEAVNQKVSNRKAKGCIYAGHSVGEDDPVMIWSEKSKDWIFTTAKMRKQYATYLD